MAKLPLTLMIKNSKPAGTWTGSVRASPDPVGIFSWAGGPARVAGTHVRDCRWATFDGRWATFDGRGGDGVVGAMESSSMRCPRFMVLRRVGSNTPCAVLASWSCGVLEATRHALSSLHRPVLDERYGTREFLHAMRCPRFMVLQTSRCGGPGCRQLGTAGRRRRLFSGRTGGGAGGGATVNVRTLSNSR